MKQLICDSLNWSGESHRQLATAIYTPVEDVGPLEGIAAGRWSAGICGGNQGEVCC